MNTPSIFIPMSSPSEVIPINDRCCIRQMERMRTVPVEGLPMFCCDLEDAVSERNAAVTLVNNGWAMQQEIAGALGVATSTVRRWQRRSDVQGSAVWIEKSAGRLC